MTTKTTSNLGLTHADVKASDLFTVGQICDAFGKGFDQFNRNLNNPYVGLSVLWSAYEYGKEVAHEQA